jgi:hypothetical protein
MTTGQAQDYAFTVTYETPGFAMGTARTAVSWTLDIGSPSPTGSGASGDAQTTGWNRHLMGVLTVALCFGLVL